MNKCKRIIFLFCTCTLLTTVVVTLNACGSLQKKFTRKKKDSKKKEVIPVFEPVDYVSLEEAPERRYAFHYSLWKVWQKDLIRGLETREGEKSLQYMLQQNISQLQELQKLLPESKKQTIAEIIKEYQTYKAKFAIHESMRNNFILSMGIERLGKRMRNEFDVEVFQSQSETQNGQ